MSQKRKESERLITSVLIDPFRQIKFGLYMIGGALAFVLASGLLFFNAFREQYKHVMGIFSIVDPNLQWDMILNDVFYTNLIRLIVFFAVFLLGMFYLTFRLTHRYYGPLVSIGRFVDEITNGNYTSRVSIRSKDELQQLVTKLNRLAEVLENRHGSQLRADGTFSRRQQGQDPQD